MKIKLGMDIRMIRHSGIGVRIQNILKHWQDHPDIELYLFGNPDHLKDNGLVFPSHREFIPYHAGIYSLSEMKGHPRMKEMDVLDIPHFNAPLLYLKKCIVTVHDLIPWVMREFHSSLAKRIYLRLVLGLLFQRAKSIITVSEFTKQDILNEFPNTTLPIKVIYNGIDHELYQPQPEKRILEFRTKYNLPKEYLLTVGIGKGHKNQEFLLGALSHFWKANPNTPPLVLAGSGGKIPDYLQDIYSKWKEKIHILPRIPDEEMPLMYQSALLLVYPSLYEGFGFPVLEASAMGTLVLSSNASVLPEVLGEGAIFFDPRSMDDFHEKLVLALNFSKAQNNDFRKKAMQQSNKFQWNETVSQLQKTILRI
ncbi:MAG: glycosyltransferase family 4 protein [Leptospira sp.]|nr:glycosyltransferase family 4 protein [Leptospira sp.]